MCGTGGKCKCYYSTVAVPYLQARAIYDFEAEPGTGEVSLRSGEVVTVTRTDVGEGWWEGEKNSEYPEENIEHLSDVESICTGSRETLHPAVITPVTHPTATGRTGAGDCGLFPEAYVEEITGTDTAPPAMAPPPLPQDYSAPAATASPGGWTEPAPAPAPAHTNTFGTTDPVDDWGADPWSGATPPAPAPQHQDWQQDVSICRGGVKRIQSESSGSEECVAERGYRCPAPRHAPPAQPDQLPQHS